MSKRRTKKSETLEVRLEHEVKSALMRKAHGEGRSTSDVVRSFIDSYLAEQPKEARSMLLSLWKPTAAIGAAAMAVIWAALAPAPLHARPDLKAVFQAMDQNGNGAIALDEFLQHPSDPAIQKMHDAHMTGGHKGAAASHGPNPQTGHARPSEETLRARFIKLDSNSDGSVKFEEFEAFHANMRASHATH